MRLRKKPWIEEAMQDLKGEYVLMHDLENYKGRWQELFPGKRLCLEIGCGKGRFIIGMAELHPEKAFIGVETQHDIAYYPGKTAKENKMDNIKVICANAEHMEDWFEPGEIKELYLNFSDPWPKARHEKRRLTYRDRLRDYAWALKPGGFVEVKTDNDALYDFTLEEIEAAGYQITEQTRDLHSSSFESKNTTTEYEDKFSGRGKNINYVKFTV